MTPPMTRATNAQTTMATIFRRPPDFCAGGCDSPHSGQNLVLLDSAALQPGHVFGMAPPKVDAVMIPPGNVPAAGVTRRDNAEEPAERSSGLPVAPVACLATMPWRPPPGDMAQSPRGSSGCGASAFAALGARLNVASMPSTWGYLIPSPASN